MNLVALCLALGLAFCHDETPPIGRTELASAPLGASLGSADLTPADLTPAHPIIWPPCEVDPPWPLKVVFADTARDMPGVSACYLAKLTWCESQWDPEAESHVGARGIAQFMPYTAEELGIDPLDPRQSIRAASRYISWQRGQWTPPVFGGREPVDVVRLGHAGWNWGLGHVLRTQERYGWVRADDAYQYVPTETRQFDSCIQKGHR